MINPWGQCDMMAVCAVEYCLGRKTYVVGECVEWLHAIWKELHPAAQAAIARTVESAYDKHERGWNGVLGMEMDKAEWDRARKLWRS